MNCLKVKKASTFLSIILLGIFSLLSASTANVYVTEMERESYVLPFKTTNQSLINSSSNGSFSIPLINESWNSGNHSIGAIINARTYINTLGLSGPVTDWLFDEIGVDSIKLGATTSASTSGRTALSFGFTDLTAGSIDINYPIDINIEAPKQNTFRGGDTIVVNTNYSPSSGWYMNSTATSGKVGLDTRIGLKSNLGVKLCAFDCTEEELLSLTIPEKDRNIFRISSTIQGNSIPYSNSFEGCEPFKPGEYARWNITYCESQYHGISGYVGFPKLETTNANLSQSGLLIDSNKYRFTELSVDLDSYLAYLGLPIPLGEETPEVKGVQVGYETINYALDIDMDQKRDISFKPNPIIKIDFGLNMNYKILKSSSNHEVLSSGEGTFVVLNVGNSLALTIPDNYKQPIPNTYTYEMKNEFSHESKILYSTSYKNEALGVKFKSPSYEIYKGANQCVLGHPEPTFSCSGIGDAKVCVPSGVRWVCDLRVDIPRINYPGTNIDLGPLYTNEIGLLGTSTKIFPKKTFELDGFETHTKTGLILDPENPIIEIKKDIGNVENLGLGVQRLTYILKVKNKGDVPLTSTNVIDVLSETFDDAKSFNIKMLHSCTDNIINEYFEGTDINNSELLNPTTLDVNEEWLITLITDVKTNAFPNDYINNAKTHGTSYPRGTVVTHENEVSINIGPQEISSYTDYAIYATHKVQIDSISDSKGDIGSAGKIEVKNGSSEVLAGTLRANEDIKVHGQITVDYSFSNESILEHGKKAELNNIFTSLEAGEFINEKEKFQPKLFELPTFEFESNGEDIYIDNSSSMSLLPSFYGDVIINKDSVLILSRGEYNFKSLSLKEGARIEFDLDSSLSPLIINVENDFKMDDNSKTVIVSIYGSTKDININVKKSGNIKLSSNTIFNGVLTAPSTKVTFEENSKVNGAVYANFISMKKHSQIEYHKTWMGELYKEIDINCDGNSDINY